MAQPQKNTARVSLPRMSYKSKKIRTSPISILFAADSRFAPRDAQWILVQFQKEDRLNIMSILRAEMRTLENTVRSSTLTKSKSWGCTSYLEQQTWCLTQATAFLSRLSEYELPQEDKAECKRILTQEHAGKNEKLGLFVRKVSLREFELKYKRKGKKCYKGG